MFWHRYCPNLHIKAGEYLRFDEANDRLVMVCLSVPSGNQAYYAGGIASNCGMM